MYCNIYKNLCESRKELKELYKPNSELHRHHITPRHSGGDDSPNNFTYLTIREHIIAHFLLWKIHGNINDLRAVSVLRGTLSLANRKILGEYCRDNYIGFHGASKDVRSKWSSIGRDTQKKLKLGIHSIEVRKVASVLGGKATLGMKCMYIPGNSNYIKVYEEHIQEKINLGYVLGRPKKITPLIELSI
jgi:hypothetical protein